MKLPKAKTILHALPAILTFAATLAGILFIMFNGAVSAESLLDFVRRHDTVALPILLTLFALKGVLTVLPYSLLTTVTGLVFDLVPALIINLVGTAICMSVPYLTGKSAGKNVRRQESLEKLRNHKLVKKYYTGKDTDLFPLCFLLRLCGLQSEVTSIFFGSVGMPYLPYLAASLLGKLALMICYTVLGATLSVSDLSPIVLVFFGIETVMLIVTIFSFRKKRKKRQAAIAAPTEETPESESIKTEASDESTASDLS